MKFIIQLASPDFHESCLFYEALEFHNLGEFEEGRYVCDGKSILLIPKDRKYRNGLLIYSENGHDDFQMKTVPSKIYNHRVTQDPNGFHIVFKFISEYPKLSKEDMTNALTGNPYGLGLETIRFKESADFWSTLGFQLSFGDLEKGGFVTLVSNGFGLGLFEHGSCPHSFNNPSLTYFNGKEGNPKIIDQVRGKNITISEEITHFNEAGEVDNIILKDPGGMGFFLFNDG